MALELPGVQVLPGERAGVSFIYHAGSGHYYHYNGGNENEGQYYFRCKFYHRHSCIARAQWTENGGLLESNDHNHLPDPLLAGTLICKERILARCRSGELTPLTSILRDERRRFPRAVQARMTYAKLRSVMADARSSIYPNVPQSLAELGQILGNPRYAVISMTEDGDDNLFASAVTATDGSKAVIFASERMLDFMSRVTWLFGDGTFCTPAAPNASQVFNIVTSWRSHISPLAIVLMERRTTALYRRVFQELKNLSPDCHPSYIMSDYEAAQTRAWQEEFPDAQHIGCLYHYMSDLIDHGKFLGMTVMMRSNPVVSKIVRYCCVIPLVPAVLIEDAFKCIAAQARTTVLYGILRIFLDYIWQTWITSVRSNILSVSGSESRTNNVSESFNRMLRKEVQVPHPNIYNFIRAVVTLEDNAITDIATLLNGESPSRPRRATSLANDAAISAWTEDLLRGFITMEDFLHNVSPRILDAYNDLVG